jgi:hypothetical protein
MVTVYVGLPYARGFPDISSFSRFRFVSGGIFYFSKNVRGFGLCLQSVASKSALELRAHGECEKQKKAVRAETSWAKVTSFLTASG